MSGLLQRRGVLGVAVIALGALLVVAVNAISGRAVPGVAQAGPPPPLPGVGSCLQVAGTDRWVPADCSSRYRGAVLAAWRTAAPAQQVTANAKRCGEQGSRAGTDGWWSPRGGQPSPVSGWVLPSVPWSARLVSGGGRAGWSACVMVAFAIDRTEPPQLTDLAEFTVPAGDLRTVAQLPAGLRRCFAGTAPVEVARGRAAVGSVGQVDCTRPHEWEQLGAFGAGAELSAGNLDSCRALAEQVVGRSTLFSDPVRPGVATLQTGLDGSTALTMDPGVGSDGIPGDPTQIGYAMPTESGCFLVSPPDRYFNRSMVGVGEQPLPYTQGR